MTQEQKDIFDTLVMDGDDIMLGLGYEQLADGSWRQEDIDAMLALEAEIGFGGIEDRIASALMAK
jgi:hypothetical protein